MTREECITPDPPVIIPVKKINPLRRWAMVGVVFTILGSLALWLRSGRIWASSAHTTHGQGPPELADEREGVMPRAPDARCRRPDQIAAGRPRSGTSAGRPSSSVSGTWPATHAANRGGRPAWPATALTETCTVILGWAGLVQIEV